MVARIRACRDVEEDEDVVFDRQVDALECIAERPLRLSSRLKPIVVD